MRNVANVTYNERSKVGSREQILDLVQAHMDQYTQAAPTPPGHPFAARWASAHCALELGRAIEQAVAGSSRIRVRDWTLSPQQHIGVNTVVELENVIGAAMHAQARAVRAEQSTGDWGAVAWEVVSSTAKIASRHQNTAPEADYFIEAAIEAARRGEPSKDRSKVMEVENEQFVVRTVWVDSANEEELDNWAEQFDKKGAIGPGRVSRRLRKEVALGLDIMRRFAARDVVHEAPPAEVTAAQADKARDLARAGVSHADIAILLSVAAETVARIVDPEPAPEPKPKPKPKR